MISHLSELLTTDSVTLRIDDFFDLPCLNVIWSLVNTRRFSYDDKHMKKMIELIDKFTMNNYVGPLGWTLDIILIMIMEPSIFFIPSLYFMEI